MNKHKLLIEYSKKKHVYSIHTILEASSLINKARCSSLVKKSNNCIACGREGTHVIKYRGLREPETTVHVDVFSSSHDHLTMMTVDHVLPRSLGGLNHVSNYQLMCEVCNRKRGNKISRLEVENILDNLNQYLSKSNNGKKFVEFLKTNHIDLYKKFENVLEDHFKQIKS